MKIKINRPRNHTFINGVLFCLATHLFILYCVNSVFAFAPGDLDLSFGTGGKTQANFFLPTQEATSIALQSDGKIVVGGYVASSGEDFAVARFNVNGTLDTTFDTDGKVTTDFGLGAASYFDQIADIAIQSDGKIVAVGNSRFAFGNTDLALARYNSDGSLDTTFNSNGLIRIGFCGPCNDYGNEVEIQTDGKIVVTGYIAFSSQSDFLTVRFNSDGSLDTGFSTDGWDSKSVTAVHDRGTGLAIQTDGKIIVGGTYGGGSTSFGSAVLKYNTDGTLDTGFDTDGVALVPSFNDRVESLAIQSDGKYVLAGSTTLANLDYAVARMNSDGTLDTSFNSTGKVTIAVGTSHEVGKAVAIQADGKIFLAGHNFNNPIDFTVVRYNVDGSLDNSFSSKSESIWGTGGVSLVDFSNQEDTANAIALDNFERVIVAGGRGAFKVTRSQNVFGPTAAAVSISGRVLSTNGRGIPGAIVHITNQEGETNTARTNQFGHYRFDGIEVGQTLIFNVFSKRYQFQTQVINLDESITKLNFIAEK